MTKYSIGFLVILLSILMLIQYPFIVHGDNGLEMAVQKSLQRVRDETGDLAIGDSNLSIVYAKKHENPIIGTVTYAVKALDNQNNKIITHYYNEDLEPISEQEAFQIRAVAYQEKYGKLSKDLYNKTQYNAGNALIPVTIWAEQSEGLPSAGSTGLQTLFLPIISGGFGGPIERIILFLQQNGYSEDYVSTVAPIVYADLPSNLILELQSESYVAAIYEQEEGAQAMYSAARTTAAPWTWSRGITGNGIKVAVLEADGVAFDNPFINGSAYYIGWWKRVDDHATAVAGVIGSSDGVERGIAFDSEILSANALSYGEPSIVAAADWAVDAGADIINASFTTKCTHRNIGAWDKYFDWLVWEKRVTVTASAGNLVANCADNYNVGSPGKAYNVITVGSKDDQNTAQSEEDVADDQFSHFSRYIDPLTSSENRLKPEVVATGEHIKTTTTSAPWISSTESNGTSLSAPIVAGQAALMMQRAPWLKDAPETVKAGIMTTARWTDLLDGDQLASIDKMGVGAVDATAADNSLINNRIQELKLHESDFSGDQYDVYFDGLEGQRIRVIIVWPSHPSRVKILDWILHDRLESDFDLTLRAPNGQIFGSYADEANYEIVEFIAPVSGSYQARIHLSRWDNSEVEERIGFAWYSGFPLP